VRKASVVVVLPANGTEGPRVAVTLNRLAERFGVVLQEAGRPTGSLDP
jgi:hypothetical protein